MLVCFCEAWSRFVHAVRMYQTEGITIVDPGQRMLAPSSGGRNRVGSRRAASQHRQRVRFVTGRRARFLNITPRDDDNPDPFAAG